jgi:hypothetical protein
MIMQLTPTSIAYTFTRYSSQIPPKMKPSFILLPTLFLLSVNAINAQKPKSFVPKESSETIHAPGTKNMIRRNPKMIPMYPQRKFLNDCSLMARSDYRLPDNYASNFVGMEDGQTYTGTKNGIIMWDNYSVIRITTENSKIPENNITTLALDNEDQLWIGTAGSGIVLGTGTDVKPFKIQVIQSYDLQVVSISVDATGLVWAVYKNGGLECFLDGISCQYFSPYLR